MAQITGTEGIQLAKVKLNENIDDINLLEQYLKTLEDTPIGDWIIVDNRHINGEMYRGVWKGISDKKSGNNDNKYSIPLDIDVVSIHNNQEGKNSKASGEFDIDLYPESHLYIGLEAVNRKLFREYYLDI